MKIVCNKNILNEAIQTVSRAVAAKSNLASIEGILFIAENNTLTLTGYDFEMGIKTTFECEVLKDGDVVLSSQLLGNIVRKANSETISIECDDKMNCIIKSGITEFNIKGIDSTDYPDFPSPSQDTSVSIENELFGEMVDYVIYAVSQDEKRPAHTGILIKLENKKLTMVALDGYRLAVCERVVDFEGNFSMIVPAKAMNEVRKIIGEKDGKLTIYSNRRYILFKASEFIVLSRLLEGDFLDYKKAIPQNFVVAATVKTKSFIDVIERVSLIITERLKNPLKLEIGENNIVVKCTTELGTVYDELDATVDGEELEIGFNNRYVLDALKASKKEELVFEFSGSLSPCVIHPKDSDDFTYLVLPVRFKND
ncbi:MAG: DNA polymerase III subunit beta [Oscillospiraceae bacterium]